MEICWVSLNWLLSKFVWCRSIASDGNFKCRKIAGQVPEEMEWAIFECLARALCVLAYGTEDVDAPVSPTWRPIAHFDIKNENSRSIVSFPDFAKRLTVIVFGGPYDAQHVKYHIMKA
jgi:hypothetical protein